eukprot:275052_1
MTPSRVVIASISLLFLMAGVGSQTTICVWNSADTWDHINGEYTKNTELYNTHPYWESESNACGTTNYIFASWYDTDSKYFWLIHPTLQQDYEIAYPDCETGFVTGTDTNPTICNAGWFEWHSDTNKIELPLTVTDGSCPSLQCDTIQVSGITTVDPVDHTVCNQIFERNTQQRNVFVHKINKNKSRYLYFNPYTFKWYCSNTLGVDECEDDANINHPLLSSLSDGWVDMSAGDSATIMMSNNEEVTFDCLSTQTSDPTESPITQSPTKTQTLNPTQDTGAPTTRSPTQHPTISPSGSPITSSPSQPTGMPITSSPTQPTQYPTAGPSGSPTTANPTGVPTTLEPTGLPTKNTESDDDDDDERGGRMSGQGIETLQMRSTENVDTTGLAVAIFIIGTFCMITMVMSCVLWVKHEKAHRPIYDERKKQILGEMEKKQKSAEIASSDSNGLEQEEDDKPKKKSSVLLSKYEVQLEDIKAGDMYEAQDGEVQFGAL